MLRPKGSNLIDEPRRRGGQPGNQNALRHGRRSRAAVIRRRLTYARLKVIALLGLKLQLFAKGDRQRPRPVRPDQVELLLKGDPDLATLWLAGR
jgi:hypothetical protein